MFVRIPLRTLLAVILSASCLPQLVRADDGSCDANTIIQPIIDAGARLAECNATGVYLAPQALVDQIRQDCLSLEARACRKCLKREIKSDSAALAALIKIGSLESSALGTFRSAAAQLACAGGNTEPPTPTPTPTPPPGNDADFGRQLRDVTCPCTSFHSHDDYVQCIGNALSSAVSSNTISHDAAAYLYRMAINSSCGTTPPTPTPSATATPTPTPSGGTDTARNLVETNCPCAQADTHTGYVHCAYETLTYAVNHNVISREVAGVEIQEVIRSTCGGSGN